MSTVAVIIPAYNPGKFLWAALESVKHQTYGEWEVLVVDDGSTEDLSWVDHLEPRIRRVRQDNEGLSAARNRGIAETESEFVAFLDADDLWLPNKLHAQLNVLRETRAGLCSTAFNIVDSTGKFRSAGFEGYAHSYVELLEGNGICVSTVLTPRSVLNEIGYFDVSLRQVQDWDLWLRIAQAHQIVRLDGILAAYRHHPDNMSNNYWNLRDEAILILARHEATARACHRQREIESARLGQRRVRHLAGVQAYDHFRSSARKGSLEGMKHLVSAARYAPGFSARALVSKARSFMENSRP